jgi:hypothetical protein
MIFSATAFVVGLWVSSGLQVFFYWRFIKISQDPALITLLDGLVISLGYGLVLGFAQGLVVYYFRGAKEGFSWWILTWVGMAIGGTIEREIDLFTAIGSSFMIQAITEFTIGSLQWVYLRKKSRVSYVWIILSPIAWLLGAYLSFSIRNVVGLFVGGAVYGLINGFVFSRLTVDPMRNSGREVAS